MKKSKVLQVCVGFVLCVLQVVVTSALDCPDKASGGTRCTISVEKLLDRAIQHAELIYRVSEESSMLFEEMFIPLSPTGQYRGPVCAPRSVPIFTSRTEIQQISDKWLLHTVLIMVQFWIDPLVDLQASLDRYDNAPSVLLNRTKWMSTKLMSLEQGVQVLIKKILGEGSLLLEGPENTGELFVSADMIESVRRDYGILYCFRKDAHKMETFLKLLKCRHTDKLNCSIF